MKVSQAICKFLRSLSEYFVTKTRCMNETNNFVCIYCKVGCSVYEYIIQGNQFNFLDKSIDYCIVCNNDTLNSSSLVSYVYNIEFSRPVTDVDRSVLSRDIARYLARCNNMQFADFIKLWSVKIVNSNLFIIRNKR